MKNLNYGFGLKYARKEMKELIDSVSVGTIDYSWRISELAWDIVPIEKGGYHGFEDVTVLRPCPDGTIIVTTEKKGTYSPNVRYVALKPDYAASFKSLYDHATKGDPRAFSWLARLYAMGEGVRKDIPTACALYCKAIMLGDKSAVRDLRTGLGGRFLGDDGSWNSIENFDVIIDFSKRGFKWAQYAAAMMAYDGKIVECDIVRSVRLALSAAYDDEVCEGYWGAKLYLSHLLVTGSLGVKNSVAAMRNLMNIKDTSFWLYSIMRLAKYSSVVTVDGDMVKKFIKVWQNLIYTQRPGYSRLDAVQPPIKGELYEADRYEFGCHGHEIYNLSNGQKEPSDSYFFVFWGGRRLNSLISEENAHGIFTFQYAKIVDVVGKTIGSRCKYGQYANKDGLPTILIWKEHGLRVELSYGGDGVYVSGCPGKNFIPWEDIMFGSIETDNKRITLVGQHRYRLSHVKSMSSYDGRIAESCHADAIGLLYTVLCELQEVIWRSDMVSSTKTKELAQYELVKNFKSAGLVMSSLGKEELDEEKCKIVVSMPTEVLSNICEDDCGKIVSLVLDGYVCRNAKDYRNQLAKTFLSKVNASRFSSRTWAALLRKHFWLIDIIDIDNLTASDWGMAMSGGVGSKEFGDILGKINFDRFNDQEKIEFCLAYEKFHGSRFYRKDILKRMKVRDLSSLSVRQLICLLEADKIYGEKFNSKRLLSTVKEYADLSLKDWLNLLSMLPESRNFFVPERYDWKALSGNEWVDLLWEFPQYKKMLDAPDIDWNVFTANDWPNLLFKFPEYKGKCDVEKIDWTVLTDSFKWGRALMCCPEEIIGHFSDWESIEPNWWPDLVKYQPKLKPYRKKYDKHMGFFARLFG